jgi:hypothetical protein
MKRARTPDTPAWRPFLSAAALVRVVIGVLAVSSFVLVSPVPGAQPALAACGTGWTDRKVPPKTIKVLRTGSGKVSEVSFRRYVAVVMASGEWPTTLHREVLEAGALATKQYGWYYALKGNHRSDYKTSSGTCYDVRDDSKDQIFSPESAEPTTKQQNAIDALWGLSLRKRDDFLLTGYRGGSSKKCAADADGWRLYTKSAKDCAKRLDYDSGRILEAYYSPGLDFVWAPGTEPPDAEDEGDAGADPTEQPDAAGADQDADPTEQPDAAGAEPTEGPDDEDAGGSDSGWFGSWIDRVMSRFADEREA